MTVRDAGGRGWREEILVFLTCTAAAALFVQGLGRIPVVKDYVFELAELTFLLVPWWVVERRREDWAEYGVHARGAGRSLAWAAAAMLVCFPPFVFGYEWWWGAVRSFDLSRLPSNFWNLALAQFLVVALPEEVLFRGYLQTRLERRLGSRERWGIRWGWAIPLTSVLFALAHFAVIPSPQRLAVFFPSLLFGWLRQRTGSILAPVVFHGACNVVGDLLYFGWMA
jgi:uncharacterized protein